MTPFLQIGQGGDRGVPMMVSVLDSEAGRIFQQVARELAEKSEELCQWPRSSDRENLDWGEEVIS